MVNVVTKWKNRCSIWVLTVQRHAAWAKFPIGVNVSVCDYCWSVWDLHPVCQMGLTPLAPMALLTAPIQTVVDAKVSVLHSAVYRNNNTNTSCNGRQCTP